MPNAFNVNAIHRDAAETGCQGYIKSVVYFRHRNAQPATVQKTYKLHMITYVDMVQGKIFVNKYEATEMSVCECHISQSHL